MTWKAKQVTWYELPFSGANDLKSNTSYMIWVGQYQYQYQWHEKQYKLHVMSWPIPIPIPITWKAIQVTWYELAKQLPLAGPSVRLEQVWANLRGFCAKHLSHKNHSPHPIMAEFCGGKLCEFDKQSLKKNILINSIYFLK